MRPRLLLAPYHGTEGAYSGVGVGKGSESRRCGAQGRWWGPGGYGAQRIARQRCSRSGITSVATVHDSCGCLAAQAERFRRIIREQFVKMYEDHDVLQEVLDWARKELAENAKGLPGKPPKNGSLNVKEILEAEYAFA